MHSDFFLTAAMPVVKVFRMLVARRSASCEPPSRPAMEPESTVALPARPRNKLLMIFLPGAGGQGRKRSHIHGAAVAIPPARVPNHPQTTMSYLGLSHMSHTLKRNKREIFKHQEGKT